MTNSQNTGAQAHINLLGVKVRDRVTSFEGVITSVSFDLFGCVQAVVQPVVGRDGKPSDGLWFDVHRLEPISIGKRGPARVMPVPAFDKVPTFGATPDTHAHGPAEKPARPS